LLVVPVFELTWIVTVAGALVSGAEHVGSGCRSSRIRRGRDRERERVGSRETRRRRVDPLLRSIVVGSVAVQRW